MLAIFPELVDLAQKQDIEYLSVRIREYFGGEVARKPLLDMDRVLDGFGITTQTVELGYPAALVADDKGGTFNAGMFFDVTVTGAQRNFLQAHLLGHFLFEFQSLIANGELKKTGYKETLLPLNRYTSDLIDPAISQKDFLREDLCNRFASALLMPKGMLIKVFSVLGDLEKVASIFGCTSECVEQRLSDLGAMVGSSSINKRAERILRGVGASTEEDSRNITSDDPSGLEAPKKVSVIKENKAKEFARSVAEENLLAMKSMNRGQNVGASAGEALAERIEEVSIVDKGTPAVDSAESALKRIRKLASKIDASVEY